mgnify:CR=1 FL=1
MFKALVYTTSFDQYAVKEKEILQSRIVKKYPHFEKHVKTDIIPRKSEWAISQCMERRLTTHNVNTTNYVEVSFRLTKDNQFNRIRAYNLVELLDIILDDSTYYVMRCLDISGNRISQLKNQKSRYLKKKCKIDPTKIEKVDDNAYMVPSERFYKDFNKMLIVNVNLSLCECLVGTLHGPCRHKQLVTDHFHISSPDLIPHENPQVCALYYYIATGEERDVNWFRSLNDVDTISLLPPSTDVFAYMRESEVPEVPSCSHSTTTNEMDDTMNNDVTDDVDYEKIENIKEEFENALDNFREVVLNRIEEDPNNY